MPRNRTDAVSPSPHFPLEVTADDVGCLRDRQLTDFLSRLLHLEAARFTLAASGVTVPVNISAPDGGEDGRIEWSNGPSCTDYVPNRLTIFQCKATEMGPAACVAELRDAVGKTKLQIDRALRQRGTYILFCTQKLNRLQQRKRLDAMRKALRRVRPSYPSPIQIDVYDAKKISDWANTAHCLPARVALLEWIGRNIPGGFQTWTQWSQKRFLTHPPFVSSSQTSGYIAQLRAQIGRPRAVARLVGLSGLGKTRLALEAFRPPIPSTSPLHDLSQRVIYLDAPGTSDALLSAVTQWCNLGLHAILVVDDCSLEIHERLKAQIERTNSNLSLLTLDYDTSKGSPVSTIELTASPHEVVRHILTGQHPRLAAPAVDRLAHFACGFPQMAVLLADAYERDATDFGILSNDYLLDRLVFARAAPDEEVRHVLTACALFEWLGVFKEMHIQYEFAAKEIAKVSADTFYRHVQTLIKQGILVRRGRMVQVVPLPLAIRLAGEWWNKCRPERTKELVQMEMPQGMDKALCERIGKLDFVPEVKALVKDLCGDVGPFGSAEVLNTERGSQLFRSLAEANPDAAADALRRMFAQMPREALTEIRAGRRNLVWTLEKLCFLEATFPRAARVLLAFAAAENEHWSNNATGMFHQLFHMYLSGTQAPPALRLSVVDEAIASGDPYRISLAIEALAHALQVHFFSRMRGSEFIGSGPPLEDWKPGKYGEMYSYWREALTRLTDIATGTGELALMAKVKIAAAVLGLVQQGRLEEVEAAIQRVVKTHGPLWPEAWETVQNLLEIDGDQLPAEVKARLQGWKALLTPHDLGERLRLTVSVPPWHDFRRDENGRYIDRGAEAAQALAAECATDPGRLFACAVVLLQGEQRQAIPFGEALARRLPEPREFIMRLVEMLASADPRTANPTLLGGLLRGLLERDRTLVENILDQMAGDSRLVRFLTSVTAWVHPSPLDLKRLLQTVQRGQTDVRDLKRLVYGGVLNHLPLANMRAFLDALRGIGEDAAWVALDLLLMYRHGHAEMLQDLRPLFCALLLGSNVRLCDYEARQGDPWHWSEAAIEVLKSGTCEARNTILEQIIELCSLHSAIDAERVVRPVLRELIKENYREAWSRLGETLASGADPASWNLSNLIHPRFGEDDEDSLLGYLPEGFLIEWCNQYPERGPEALADLVSPIQRDPREEEGGVGGAALTWTPLAKTLIDRYGRRRGVLDAIARNLQSGGWTGSMVPFWQRLIAPLSELSGHRLREVRDWADKLLRGVRQEIPRQRAREEEELS